MTLSVSRIGVNFDVIIKLVAKNANHHCHHHHYGGVGRLVCLRAKCISHFWSCHVLYIWTLCVGASLTLGVLGLRYLFELHFSPIWRSALPNNLRPNQLFPVLISTVRCSLLTLSWRSIQSHALIAPRCYICLRRVTDSTVLPLYINTLHMTTWLGYRFSKDINRPHGNRNRCDKGHAILPSRNCDIRFDQHHHHHHHRHGHQS